MEATQTVNLSDASIEALADAIGDRVSIETTLTMPETFTASIPETLTANVSRMGPIDSGGILAIALLVVVISSVWLGGTVTDRWILSKH